MTMGITPDKHWEDRKHYRDRRFVQQDCGSETLTGKIRWAIEVLKQQDINGCITGSTLLDCDFDTWDKAPDIDIFVYTEQELIRTIGLLELKLGMIPGKGSEASNRQEKWKLDRLRKYGGTTKKFNLTTASFYADMGDNHIIVVNVTNKKNCENILQVLGSFDMSIIMRGYDIHSHFWLDIRTEPVNVAQPNLLRSHDAELWTVSKWIRQWDRVIKYYNRGFDTRPMARFYLELIDEALAGGELFTTEKGKETYAQFAVEFLQVKEVIKEWLEVHDED